MADDDEEEGRSAVAGSGAVVIGSSGCVDVEEVHNVIQYVARSLPWLFIDPNLSSTIIVTNQVEEVEEEDDDISKSASTLSNSELSVSLSDANDTEVYGDEATEQQNGDSENEEEEEIIRQKLSLRTYHLDGNNWCDDWRMYITNNHLVFGICCHHPLHPVNGVHRFILLLGSLAFGLIVTNLVYLWGDSDMFNDADDAITSWANKFQDTNIHVAGHSLSMYATQIGILWTVGSSLHSFFDFALWHLIACGHCKKRHVSAGWTLVVFLVMIVVSIMTAMLYFRAFGLEEEEEEDGVDEQEEELFTDDVIGTALNLATSVKPDFRFLYAYSIELFLSLFVYTPLVQTIVFSGILGCGWMPFLGGRPRALSTLRREEKNTRAEF